MPTTVQRTIGSEELIIETGKLAMQAHGAVTVRYGETIVLATAVMAEKGCAIIVPMLLRGRRTKS